MRKKYTYLEVDCEEYFFKSNRNLRKLFDTDTWELMQFKKDKKLYRNDIQRCKNKEEIVAMIAVPLDNWRGNKRDWISYTKMAVNPHKDFVFKDYFYYVLNQIDLYLSQNEYDFFKVTRLF